MKKRGQVSLEYLAIFSFAVLLTIPLVTVYFVQQNNIQSDITMARANRIAQELVSTAEDVYYMGYPSQRTIDITFPPGIAHVEVHSFGLTFTIVTQDRILEVFRQSNVNLSGEIRSFEGRHVIVVKNEGGFINFEDR